MSDLTRYTDQQLMQAAGIPLELYHPDFVQHLAVKGSDVPYRSPRAVDTRTFQQYDRSNQAAQRQIGSSPVGVLLPNNPYRAQAEDAVVKNVASAMTDPMFAGTFAGVGAKTADLVKLSKARQMLSGLERGTPDFAAADRAAWQETGWTHAFPDGKPRFEVSDHAATTLQPRLPAEFIDGYGNAEKWNVKDVLDHPDLYDAYPNIRNINSSFQEKAGSQGSYSDLAGGWISYDKGMRKPLLSEDQQQAIDSLRAKVTEFDNQPHVIAYDKALEDAGHANPDFEKIFNAHNGTEIERARQPLVDEWLAVDKQMRAYPKGGHTLSPVSKPTTMHEIQHAVQDREGFARGGSPESYRQQQEAELARDALSWRSELLRKRKEYPNADWSAIENAVVEEYGKLGAMDMLPSREARDLARQPNVLFPDKYPNSPEGLNDLQELVKVYGLDSRVTPLSGNEVYHRLAGEAESRLTQKRMNLAPEERLAQYPIDQFDVPVEQQIVRTPREALYTNP